VRGEIKMIKATVYLKEKSTGKYFITAENEKDLEVEILNLELSDVQWDTRWPEYEIVKVERIENND
jgi:hypothetical protein